MVYKTLHLGKVNSVTQVEMKGALAIKGLNIIKTQYTYGVSTCYCGC